MLKIDQRGQSAVEFVLIAPFLFLIFFAIIQVSYFAFTSLAIQRAALCIARTASLSTDRQTNLAFKTKLGFALFPLASLSPKTTLTILASQIKITPSADNKQVTAQVRYPMPIWVPMAGRLFGETLVPSFDYQGSPEGKVIQDIFSFFGKPAPDLSFEGIQLPVRWINYEESTFNEGYDPNR